MHASTRSLLAEIVDYAGLFPPAKLELEPALRNFLGYQTHAEAWMLGRFVCPTAKFDDLAMLVGQNAKSGLTARIAALGRGGDDAETFLSGIDADLAAMRALSDKTAGRANADAFETKLPADLLAKKDGKAIRNLLDAVGERFDRAGFGGVSRFFEATLAEPWRETIRTAIAGVARHNHRIHPHVAPDLRVQPSQPAGLDGLKLRTGGVAAAAFPSTEQVAYVIGQCRDAHVPLKFTAGLHHPLRRFDAGIRTMMHGFLNLFVAAALAHAAAFDFHDILAVVEELDANAFQFSEEFVSWNDADASSGEIAVVRRHNAISFGSCSFDEPREDLRALRII